MRVQVNLSDEMVKKVDDYAKMIGVSRSALCSMFIGQSIMSYDKGLELMNKLSDTYLSQALDDRVSSLKE